MISEKILAGVAVNLLKKPMDKLYQLAEEKIKSHYANWMKPENIKLAPIALEKARTIKTICNRSTGINLFDIYHPAKIKTASGKKIQCQHIDDLVSYAGTENIILCGLAGQGKSVFVRFLWVNEINKGESIPLLINLRDINNKDVRLKGLILSSLAVLGISIGEDEKALNALLSSGLVKILLDGLDEVNREHMLNIKHELIDLASRYTKTTIIITSRPGALVDYINEIPTFKQLEIAKIEESEFFEFLVKIGTGVSIAEKLVNSVKGKGIKDVIDTPLMLTLLVQVYGSRETIPDSLPELYEEMFHILAHTHDETKPGYVREWATRLSTGEISTLFEAFSYASIECASSSLNEDQFNEAHKHAKEITNIKCTATGFRTDMVESICLMAREGINTTYIHRSIQEFYAAFFLSHQDDNEDAYIKEFYKSISSIGRLVRLENVLAFLSKIDQIRYVQYFLKPQWEEFKEMHQKNSKNTSDTLKSVFRKRQTSEFDFDFDGVKFFEWQIIKMVMSQVQVSSDMQVKNIDLEKASLLFESYKAKIEKTIASTEKTSVRKQKSLLALLSKTKPKNA